MRLKRLFEAEQMLRLRSPWKARLLCDPSAPVDSRARTSAPMFACFQHDYTALSLQHRPAAVEGSAIAPEITL